MHKIRKRIISLMVIFIALIIISVIYIFTNLFQLEGNDNYHIKSDGVVFEGEESTLKLYEGNYQDVNVSGVLKYSFYSILSMQVLIFLFLAVGLSLYISNITITPIDKASEYLSNMKFGMPKRKHGLTNGEFGTLIRECNEITEKIDSVYNEMETFNSFATHELRNSLAILSTKAQLNMGNEEIKSYIGMLSNTVEDMLLLSSSRRVKDMDFSSIDLAIIAARAVDEYSIKKNNIELIIPEDGVEEIQGKEVWVYRCICNLLENSIKYGYEETPIIVEIEETLNSVLLKVKDQGKGMDAQNIKYIFEPFYRIKESKKDGHGIGLALVKKVVDLMNGAIWVESKRNVGSQFYIAFPIKQESEI